MPLLCTIKALTTRQYVDEVAIAAALLSSIRDQPNKCFLKYPWHYNRKIQKKVGKENIRPNCVSHVKEEKPQQDKKNEDSGRDVPSDENTLKINVPSGIKKIIIEKEGKCVTIEI